jgi:DNA-binding NtrC family response regulator
MGDPSAMTPPFPKETVMMEQCGTLLIAERGCELSDCLHPWLIENGHHCIKVDTIKDVLMTLQNEKVNVLVMDVSLPESLGYDAISIIKGLYRKLPIIVTADENNPEQESRIRRKGIFYYHVKSFGIDELMLAISNALMRSYSGGKADAFTRKT